MAMQPLDASVRSHLNWHLDQIGKAMDADVVALVSPILPGLDRRLRDAIEAVGELRDEVGLKIDDLAAEPDLYGFIRTYFDLLKDYMGRHELYSFVHSKGYF